MQIKTSLTLAAIGAGLLLSTLSAEAQQARPDTAVPAEGSRAAAGGPDFATLDSDGDGRLTSAELRAGRAAMRGAGPDARFAEADADGDGRLSRDELVARIDAMIDRVDADGDGALSKAEMAAHRPDRGRRGGHGPMGRKDYGGRAGGMHGRALFERADIDGDGALDRAEWDSMAPAAPAR